MILITDTDFEIMQSSALSGFYKKLIEKLDNNRATDTDFYQIRTYVFELLKYALMGKQEYARLYSLTEEILLSREALSFFNTVHTKQEIFDFVKSLINKEPIIVCPLIT